MITTFLVYATWWIMLRLIRIGNTRERQVKVGDGTRVVRKMKKRKVYTVKDNIKFETQSRGS